MARYWLFKSEPSDYSIQDLRKEKRKTACWDGVRNYQARNLLRDEVKKGDRVFFYHSNSKPSGVVGIAEVAKEGYPDPTAFDPKAKHFDPKSDPDNPRWYAVDLRFVEEFDGTVALATLRETKGLEDMLLLRRGQRLSIQKVSAKEWKVVTKMAGAKKG